MVLRKQNGQFVNRPYGVGTSCAPLSLLFREKSRLRMLGVYKCTHIRIRGTTNFSRWFENAEKA